MDSLSKYYVGASGRLIVFALHKDDKYYNILSIIEGFPEGMDYDDQFKPNHKNAFIESLDSIPGKKAKVYVGVEKIKITQDLLDNPQSGLRLAGSKLENFDSIFNSRCSDWIELPDNSTEIASILPTRYTAVKIKEFRPLTNTAMNLLREDKVASQLRFLSDEYFDFDITKHSSLYGSYLVALYTPIFSNLSFRAASDHMGLYCRINFRTKDHPKMTFKIKTYERDNSVLEERPFTTEDDFLYFFKFDKPYHHIDVEVFDADGNLIDQRKTMTFISSIHVDTAIKTKDVRYTDSKGNSKVVEKFVSEPTMIIGEKEQPKSLFGSTPEFTYEKFEKSLDFIFFDGDKDNADKNVAKAKECVLRIINGAHKICYICDIFFKEKTFLNFLLDLNSLSTNVRIISSKEKLKPIEQNELANEIKKANEVVGHKIECRLLRGDKAALHDRIIVADDNVWMIGCSLDEFGVRATTLIRVPTEYAPKIIEGVEKWWNDDKLTDKLI